MIASIAFISVAPLHTYRAISKSVRIVTHIAHPPRTDLHRRVLRAEVDRGAEEER